MKRWLPIRKIAVAGVGAGLTWAALRLGLDLGSDAANQAAVAIVGGAFGYAERDPKVGHVLDEIEGVLRTTEATPCDCVKTGARHGE